MEGTARDVDARLARLAPMLAPGATAIAGLRRLTGGASLETWAFEAIGPGVAEPRILRRRAVATEDAGETTLPLAVEAALLESAARAGVPVARLVHLCGEADGLGEAYVMTHVAGETLGRRIVAGDAFAPARDVLGGQCGTALARIHGMAATGLPAFDAVATHARYRAIWREAGVVRPAIEAAFVWLEDRMPEPVAARLVHGDFRTGNLMVDADAGLAAVLDWELSHLGDPAEDIGWLMVNSWRFGATGRAAGGFADLDTVLDAYAAAGGEEPSRGRIGWWQAMGSLKWAVMSNMLFRAGGVSPERAVIGRRLSECEVDLVALMAAAA